MLPSQSGQGILTLRTECVLLDMMQLAQTGER